MKCCHPAALCFFTGINLFLYICTLMVKCRKYFGLFLVAVYAFFFASTNLFYHTHQIADFILVHSHPFSGAGHSHTADQVLLIDAIDSSIYQESSAISAPDMIPALPCLVISMGREADVLSAPTFPFSLRAPPASC